MKDAGLPVRPEWQISADFTIQGAYASARRLLGMGTERPTAVFAASDEMAIGTILAARDFRPPGSARPVRHRHGRPRAR